MMGEKVAVRYARALYEIAAENNEVALYGDTMKAVAKQCEENEELKIFLVSAHVPVAAKKEVIDQVFSKVPEMVKNFLYLLVDKKREELIEAISASYQRVVDEETNALEVSVVSAQKLNAEERSALTRRLEEVSGCSVRLVTKEDQSLIGGLTVQIGNRWIDGSLKGRLQSFGQALLKRSQKQMEVEG